ncbi:unnamed protein product [Victoria cruziana]
MKSPCTRCLQRVGQSPTTEECCCNSTEQGSRLHGRLIEEWALESSIEGALSHRCVVCALLEGVEIAKAEEQQPWVTLPSILIAHHFH